MGRFPPSFNSLFEMHHRRKHGDVGNRRPFNSLFEMRACLDAARRREDVRSFQFSI